MRMYGALIFGHCASHDYSLIIMKDKEEKRKSRRKRNRTVKGKESPHENSGQTRKKLPFKWTAIFGLFRVCGCTVDTV